VVLYRITHVLSSLTILSPRRCTFNDPSKRNNNKNDSPLPTLTHYPSSTPTQSAITMQHQHQHHHHPFFDFDATSTYAPLQSSDQSSSVTIPRSHARASPALFTTKARNIDLSVLDHQYSSPVPVREETRGKTYPVPVGGGRFAFVGGNGGGERGMQIQPSLRRELC
jgi:hypothetical protein